MTAKEQLRERIDAFSEEQAERTLHLLDDFDAGEPRDALGDMLAAAPIDDEPTTPDEDEGAREAREQIKSGDVFSAEQIKREIA